MSNTPNTIWFWERVNLIKCICISTLITRGFVGPSPQVPCGHIHTSGPTSHRVIMWRIRPNKYSPDSWSTVIRFIFGQILLCLAANYIQARPQPQMSSKVQAAENMLPLLMPDFGAATHDQLIMKLLNALFIEHIVNYLWFQSCLCFSFSTLSFSCCSSYEIDKFFMLCSCDTT